MKFPTKIPTIFGLILVILIVGTTIFLTERSLRAPSNASESEQPVNVQITNIMDASFTVTWTTSAPTTGTVLISSPAKNNRVYYDDRDSSGKLDKYTTHYISVRDAQANTNYSIKILSNGRQYTNKSKPYEVRTPDNLPPNSNALEPAYGTIKTPDGSPAEGALVYLKFDGGQELSALTKSSGLWLIPLSQMRTDDLSGFLTTSDRMTETILVRSPQGQITATTDPLNDSPVPDMTIGQTYDFRGLQVNKISGKTLARETTPAGGAVMGQATANPTDLKVTLITPKEGDSLPTALPLVSGTGIPGKFVGISLGITTPTSGSVKVKTDGTWNYTPPKKLAAGKQSVTITTVDETDKTVAITHAFQILKSGTQVLGDATPSATLTITLTLTPSPTMTQSSTVTATPTTILTVTPTDIPESTLSGDVIPTSGNELPAILLLILGLGLLATGIMAIKL